MFHEFIPKSYLHLRAGYSFALFKKDLIAGITVGIIALPLAMAFAIASGVSPDRGLFTAIVAGFFISALGGSRVQIGGPTGAFVVVVYDIIARTGYEGLALSTLIASVILILLGVFRLGSWIKYVPHPLVIGFTSGLSLLIFSSQIRDFFGLQMENLPPKFIGQWIAYGHAFTTLQMPTLLLGSGTLALILWIRRFIPKIPWGIAAIVLGTLLSYGLDLPVATIATKFGQLPRTLPLPSFPSLNVPYDKLTEIFMGGVTIAFLGAIESLLSAVIADGMIGGKHKSNCELIGQGIANFASIIFGGIPATGAIARTATNVKTGAVSPMAGVIHALTLFVILLCLAPVVSQIPLVVLSAVLMMIAWNMSELSHFIHLLKAPTGDVALLITTFLLTVFVDITVAITVGMILSSLIFMKTMSQYSKTVQLLPLSNDPTKRVEVYEMQGPFFFGAADMLQDLLTAATPQIFILKLQHVPMIDLSGMHALKEFHQKCLKQNTILLLSGVQGQAEKDLRKLGLTKKIGEDHLFPHIDAALQGAEVLLKNSPNSSKEGLSAGSLETAR